MNKIDLTKGKCLEEKAFMVKHSKTWIKPALDMAIEQPENDVYIQSVPGRIPRFEDNGETYGLHYAVYLLPQQDLGSLGFKERTGKFLSQEVDHSEIKEFLAGAAYQAKLNSSRTLELIARFNTETKAWALYTRIEEKI
jgi:hypothetical protein